MRLQYFLFALALAFVMAGNSTAQQPEEQADGACPDVEWILGEWRGEIQGTGRAVIFRFSEDERACVTGNFDIADEDRDRVPFSEVEMLEGQIVHARSDAMEFTYKGQYEGGRIVGEFMQTGTVFALDLEPVTRSGY
ncbi:MAG: hypothetical protein KGY48_03220 [Wenzhouxiangellaceae bacterium]|nr:hypothetical protein [Wenzhouxiangellaceae bacterium]MBS3747351.1 hypothetical protein [Wenzhouxiangellaceae bacterium]MBS3822964.1 hypothetical protein [Wenzhouxiangellaceae bacterium]